MLFTQHWTVVVSLLCAGLTCTSALSTPPTARSVRLWARNQVVNPSIIPSECTSACNVFINALNTCTTDACVCTNPVNAGYETCYSCFLGLVSNPTQSTIEQIQSNIAGYEDVCTEEGFQVSSLTVSVATPTGSVPTSDLISTIPGFTFSPSSVGNAAAATSPAAKSGASLSSTPANAMLLALTGVAAVFLF